MALAIFDDIGAIVIITIFYQSTLHIPALLVALVLVAILFVMNLRGVYTLWPYIVVGILLWLVVLESGIHPTLAGVLLAFAIPLRTEKKSQLSLLHKLENTLHPWVAYGVLPLFSFANAGISFSGVRFTELLTPVTWGIVAGLWIGKQVGIFGATWLAIRSGLAPMLEGASWRAIYGTSLLCGIGFTMSLFIGNLAYQDIDSTYAVMVRFGVFLGSILSGVCGYILLRGSGPTKAKKL
jgi:NhaA family Na+:H+ antiporter